MTEDQQIQATMIDCDECSGAGTQECGECGTPEAVDCDTCGGTGEVEQEES
jgi:DnaJ-class molecular chaperone